MKIESGQTYVNRLGVELEITGSAGRTYRVLSSDIWSAVRRNDLFGAEWLVTEKSLTDAEYTLKEVSE